MGNDPPTESLSETLAGASGSDAGIDQAIAQAFGVEQAGYTSDAATARNLVAQVVPQATLRVGYDVRGVLPCATISSGPVRHSSVAPTVPLAILRALLLVATPSG